MLTDARRARLREGLVIPAHALALTSARALDETRQCGLTAYYREAGAGGVAVGVHTTQFEIRQAGLYLRVLELATQHVSSEMLLVAGVMGPTANAVQEAEVARSLGYDLALVAPIGWGAEDDATILDAARAVSQVLPIFGFYLQPTLSGRRFGHDFWRAYAEIPGVAAIKVAPFDRYATHDVVRAVVEAGRADDIALYTGNDDNIVIDLLTPYRVGETVVHIVGGLLGQWAVGTRAAVELHRAVRAVVASGGAVPRELLTTAAELTDLNSAVFDVANRFAGSIAGVNEVLVRQGLLVGNWCLEDRERLSPGQAAEITRVLAAYPALVDSVRG